jgi:hypothetical protein
MSFNLVPQAYANSDFDLGEKYTLGIGGREVREVYSTPADLVNLLASNIMVIGGIILFFMVILAGFKFLQDSSKGKEEAINIMKAALVGFILMFSAYWIVQIVKVITGTDILL